QNKEEISRHLSQLCDYEFVECSMILVSEASFVAIQRLRSTAGSTITWAQMQQPKVKWQSSICPSSHRKSFISSSLFWPALSLRLSNITAAPIRRGFLCQLFSFLKKPIDLSGEVGMMKGPHQLLFSFAERPSNGLHGKVGNSDWGWSYLPKDHRSCPPRY